MYTFENNSGTWLSESKNTLKMIIKDDYQYAYPGSDKYGISTFSWSSEGALQEASRDIGSWSSWFEQETSQIVRKNHKNPNEPKWIDLNWSKLNGGPTSTDQCLARLRGLNAWLDRLDILDEVNNVDKRTFRQLQRRTIRKINMNGCRMGEAGAKILGCTIKENKAYDTKDQAWRKQNGIIRRLPHLEFLDLYGNDIGSAAAQAIAFGLKDLQHLLYLDIGSNKLYENEYEGLRSFLNVFGNRNSKLASIECLRLGSNKLDFEENKLDFKEILASGLGNLRNLKRLTLLDNEISVMGAKLLLDAMVNCSHIVELNLACNHLALDKLNTEDCVQLCTRIITANTQLQTLSLFYNDLETIGSLQSETGAACVATAIWESQTLQDVHLGAGPGICHIKWKTSSTTTIHEPRKLNITGTYKNLVRSLLEMYSDENTDQRIISLNIAGNNLGNNAPDVVPLALITVLEKSCKTLEFVNIAENNFSETAVDHVRQLILKCDTPCEFVAQQSKSGPQQPTSVPQQPTSVPQQPTSVPDDFSGFRF